MQLIKVYSNKPTFRTVEFNPTGASFIIAKQKDSKSKDKGKTYNGVGKSLLVRIIHFCLGGSVDSYKSFCKKLEGWEFNIDIILDNEPLTISRSANEPKKIFIGDAEHNITKFNNIMGEKCFNIPDEVGYLSYRTLLPFFIRPNKASYTDCKKPGRTGKEYQVLLNNTFLLGLDVFLAQKKQKLRVEQEKIRKLEKNFKDDPLLQDFFTGNKNVKLNIADLEYNIEGLEKDLKKFQVADDYHDIQKEADSVESRLFELNNEIALLQKNIKSIEKNFSLKTHMKSTDIESVYSEAKVNFPDTVKKTLKDIEDFYSKLISNRTLRLLEQKNSLTERINIKTDESEKLKHSLDKHMKYLGEHQALDLFITLSNKLSGYINEKENLDKYQKLQSDYKSKERKTEKDMIELSDQTDIYLDEIETITTTLSDTFRDLVKIFYPKSIAGLTVNTNEGENQLLYNLDAKIESDASDGINNVKIFCYDMTILLKGYNHNIDFIFHDSRLYDGTDERQKADMFTIIKDYIIGSDKQYISTINQNQLEEIKRQLPPEDYENIIVKNTKLVLTDDNDTEKLLGIKVDIREN